MDIAQSEKVPPSFAWAQNKSAKWELNENYPVPFRAKHYSGSLGQNLVGVGSLRPVGGSGMLTLGVSLQQDRKVVCLILKFITHLFSISN